jgi:hypothetical protein
VEILVAEASQAAVAVGLFSAITLRDAVQSGFDDLVLGARDLKSTAGGVIHRIGVSFMAVKDRGPSALPEKNFRRGVGPRYLTPVRKNSHCQLRIADASAGASATGRPAAWRAIPEVGSRRLPGISGRAISKGPAPCVRGAQFPRGRPHARTRIEAHRDRRRYICRMHGPMGCERPAGRDAPQGDFKVACLGYSSPDVRIVCDYVA